MQHLERPAIHAAGLLLSGGSEGSTEGAGGLPNGGGRAGGFRHLERPAELARARGVAAGHVGRSDRHEVVVPQVDVDGVLWVALRPPELAR